MDGYQSDMFQSQYQYNTGGTSKQAKKKNHYLKQLKKSAQNNWQVDNLVARVNPRATSTFIQFIESS